MATVRIVQVDAFTSEPFSGNPAAICVLPEARSPLWMQRVAAEMNLSETAFLVRQTAGFELRWFTPTVEVDLCGHATLASAHVLWEDRHLQPNELAHFYTCSGRLTAARKGKWIELDFPATPEFAADLPLGLSDALGAVPVYVGLSRRQIYLLEMDSETTVRNLKPDFRRLAEIGRGFIATSRSQLPGCDFVSRYFGPAVGVDEDPVTGSAHCCLATFWHKRLGQTSFAARQISSRGGIVKVQLTGDRVLLSGEAVTVMRGDLLV